MAINMNTITTPPQVKVLEHVRQFVENYLVYYFPEG